MKLNDAFPSKYLKAADLNGGRVTVQINTVEMETLGDESKPVVYFVNKAKGMVLNRINAQTIAAIAGSDDTDDWHGTAVRLYATPVLFQGKMVPSIRVEAAPQAAKPAPRKPAPVPVEAFDEPDPTDDVPF